MLVIPFKTFAEQNTDGSEYEICWNFYLQGFWLTLAKGKSWARGDSVMCVDFWSDQTFCSSSCTASYAACLIAGDSSDPPKLPARCSCYMISSSLPAFAKPMNGLFGSSCSKSSTSTWTSSVPSTLTSDRRTFGVLRYFWKVSSSTSGTCISSPPSGCWACTASAIVTFAKILYYLSRMW